MLKNQKLFLKLKKNRTEKMFEYLKMLKTLLLCIILKWKIVPKCKKYAARIQKCFKIKNFNLFDKKYKIKNCQKMKKCPQMR